MNELKLAYKKFQFLVSLIDNINRSANTFLNTHWLVSGWVFYLTVIKIKRKLDNLKRHTQPSKVMYALRRI